MATTFVVLLAGSGYCKPGDRHRRTVRRCPRQLTCSRALAELSIPPLSSKQVPTVPFEVVCGLECCGQRASFYSKVCSSSSIQQQRSDRCWPFHRAKQDTRKDLWVAALSSRTAKEQERLYWCKASSKAFCKLQIYSDVIPNQRGRARLVALPHSGCIS